MAQGEKNFCPTPTDLGCDINLNKLTAEGLCRATVSDRISQGDNRHMTWTI